MDTLGGFAPPLPKEKSEPDTVSDTDTGMTSHIVCPHCNPDWVGKMGQAALCGEKLLGILADGTNPCTPCTKLWFKHVREVHMSFGDRG